MAKVQFLPNKYREADSRGSGLSHESHGTENGSNQAISEISCVGKLLSTT